MYMMVALSFAFLRKNQPDLERPYKVKYGKFVGTMAILVAIFFAWLYTPLGPSPLIGIEWLLVISWFVLGIALAIYAKIKYKDVTEKERQILLFGEK
jgi:amino acid transporter